VAVRTGDTLAAQRQAMTRRPPHILITTPESLYILLTSAGFRPALSRARFVIVDEVHALLGSKRGAHLALSLERLQALVQEAGEPRPQRIGLLGHRAPGRGGAGVCHRRHRARARDRGRRLLARPRRGRGLAVDDFPHGDERHGVGRDAAAGGRAGAGAPHDAGLRPRAADPPNDWRAT